MTVPPFDPDLPLAADPLILAFDRGFDEGYEVGYQDGYDAALELGDQDDP
jgi:hypothetical protein